MKRTSHVTLTDNRLKNGVELRFSSKPAEHVRDALKAHGWRWSRFASCWYHTATAEARAWAESIVAEYGSD